MEEQNSEYIYQKLHINDNYKNINMQIKIPNTIVDNQSFFFMPLIYLCVGEHIRFPKIFNSIFNLSIMKFEILYECKKLREFHDFDSFIQTLKDNFKLFNIYEKKDIDQFEDEKYHIPLNKQYELLYIDDHKLYEHLLEFFISDIVNIYNIKNINRNYLDNQIIII